MKKTKTKTKPTKNILLIVVVASLVVLGIFLGSIALFDAQRAAESPSDHPCADGGPKTVVVNGEVIIQEATIDCIMSSGDDTN